MQKLLFAIIFVFCGLVSKECRSQTGAADDTLAIKNMLGDLRQLIDSNLDSTLILAKEIEQRAYRINYRTGAWEAQIYRGRALYTLGHPDSSKVLLEKVLIETQEQKHRLEEIKAHSALALILQNDYNFQPAIDHLIQAEKLLKESDPFELRFEILNKQATTHRKMMDYTNALKYFNILENNYFNQMNTIQRYTLFQNKGNVYAVMKEFSKAEEFFKKAYNEITKTNSPTNIAAITYNLGALFYQQKKFTEAKEYISKSLEASLKIGDRAKTERCYRVLGSIYRDKMIILRP